MNASAASQPAMAPRHRARCSRASSDRLHPAEVVLDRLDDVEQIDLVHSIIWEIQEPNVRRAQDRVCHAGVARQFHDVGLCDRTIARSKAARHAFRKDEDRHFVAGGGVAGDRATAADDFIIRMRGHDRNPLLRVFW